MEIEFKKILSNKEQLSFKIIEQEMNGITGNTKEELEEIISLRLPKQITIKKNNIIYKEEDKKEFKNKLSIVKEEWENTAYVRTVKERMLEEIKRKNLIINNKEKKIKDSLKIIGLKISILERDCYTLSSSEKKLLQLAISLLSNPEIIILEEPFKYLDLKKEKNVIILLRKIIEQYNKTIIIVSEDSEILYKYTNYIIMSQQHKIILEGKTKSIYQKNDILKNNKIDIPKIIEFTNIAKTLKKVKLDYHIDVRDIIKDIYKHV